MNINGIEIEFDLDIRKDYARFAKAYKVIEDRAKKGMNDNDMENFLTACLNPEQTKELLADGRVSTLAKVFTEFFSNAIEQMSSVSDVYAETAEIIVTMNERASEVMAKYTETKERISGGVE